MTGGFTGAPAAQSLGSCNTTKLSLLPTWAKPQGRLGILWHQTAQYTSGSNLKSDAQLQTGYCDTHHATPPIEKERTHTTGTHDTSSHWDQEELQMETWEITTSFTLSKEGCVRR